MNMTDFVNFTGSHRQWSGNFISNDNNFRSLSHALLISLKVEKRKCLQNHFKIKTPDPDNFCLDKNSIPNPIEKTKSDVPRLDVDCTERKIWCN